MALVSANNPEVRRAGNALKTRGKLSNIEAVEEVIADIPTSQLIKLKGWRKVTVKIGEDRCIQTVTPMHGEKGVSGRDYFANLLEQALATSGAKVYARNKEALVKTRASQELPIGTFNPNQSTFTGRFQPQLLCTVLPETKQYYGIGTML
jgi:hypothetical protein